MSVKTEALRILDMDWLFFKRENLLGNGGHMESKNAPPYYDPFRRDNKPCIFSIISNEPCDHEKYENVYETRVKV